MRKITLSRAEAAEALGVSLETLDKLIAAGALPAARLGRRVIIRVADIQKMLDANRAVQP